MAPGTHAVSRHPQRRLPQHGYRLGLSRVAGRLRRCSRRPSAACAHSGAIGVNVTMPHKEAVIAHLDERVGRRPHGRGGQHDPAAGGQAHRSQHRRRRFPTVPRRRCGGRRQRAGRSLVLGAGGAARAVVKALDDLGAGEITVAARRPERGANLLELATHGPATVVAWEEAETTRRASSMW